MARNYDQTPTFLGYSEGAIGVIAGGGFSGYGGIMLHEPTDQEFHRISQVTEDETSEPKGIGFGYSEVATITVSGLLKWTNYNLNRAPKGRQDVRETGPVRIEVFDEEGLRQYVEEKSKLFERLGIKFIG
jgi:hypothetical protein